MDAVVVEIMAACLLPLVRPDDEDVAVVGGDDAKLAYDDAAVVVEIVDLARYSY